jgi:hypothetical protein
MCLEDRPVLEPNAAGIDVGAREMFVAVPPGRDDNPVRVFATFTEDLERLTPLFPSISAAPFRFTRLCKIAPWVFRLFSC